MKTNIIQKIAILCLLQQRILPTGRLDNINQKGIAYYKDLISKLRTNHIEPIVTMQHWDTPRALEEEGGFLNESVIIPAFVEYASLLWETFGDDVKWWTTFNEPKQICGGGYDYGWISPQNLNPGRGGYICTHNLLRAHAKAYRVYEKKFRSRQNGKISMNLDSTWHEPATNSSKDSKAQERVLEFWYGWFANPIVNGDYPDVMKQRIAKRSKEQNLTESRLPVFTDEEKQELKGSYDFLTINMYTTNLVKAIEDTPAGSPSYDDDVSVNAYQPDDWPQTVTSWFKVVPWGARHLLRWIKNRFGDEKGIFITENGYHDNGQDLTDLDTRGRYHKLYLSNINDAMYEDGVNVIGYMVWSMINDVEWYSGWTVSMGHYHVDYDSVNKTRTAKESAGYYKKIVTTGCLVNSCEPL